VIGAMNEPAPALAYAEGGPRFFGVDERAPGEALFGWYHPPAQGVPGRLPVLLCPPIGYEAVCVYRAYRHLAERLALAGSPVLRFAYHGTGDSSGTDWDPDRLGAWLGSVDRAIDELKRLTGAKEVVLFGVRLGATLAVAGARERSDVAALVLFAPLASGKLYVREVRAFRLMAEKELRGAPPGVSGRGEGDEESAGFVLTAPTVEALSALDLTKLERRPAASALVILRDDVPGNEQKLVRHLQQLGTGTDERALAGYGAMMQDPHKSIIPDTVFDAVTGFIGGIPAGVAPPAATAGSRTMAAAGAATDALYCSGAGAASVRERIERVPYGGAGGALFTVVTEPAQGTGRRAPCVLFLNAGAVHRVGPNRMYVTLARALAERGLTSARLDLSGLGDSPPVPGAPENKIYSTDVVRDVRVAIEALSRRLGVDRFVLAGLCAGAYVSFHAGLVERAVVGEVLINPQTFYFKEGDSLDIGVRQTFSEARRYQRQAFRLDSWKKALRGEVDWKYVADVMRDRARDVVQAKVNDVLFRLGRGDPEARDLHTSFRQMAERGVHTLLVFSGDDPGLDYLESKLGHQMAALRRSPAIQLEIIEGPDHTFTPLWSQVRLAEVIMRYIVERYAS
jgi:alpha-beta hydrolase superfamily lysophospholipase